VREYLKDEGKHRGRPVAIGVGKAIDQCYARPFELSKFKDHYDEALRELVEAKINNQPVAEQESAKKPTKVIDLMDALRKSLAQKGGGRHCFKKLEDRAPKRRRAACEPGQGKRRKCGQEGSGKEAQVCVGTLCPRWPGRFSAVADTSSKRSFCSRGRTPPWCRASEGIFAAFDEQS